MSKRRRERPAKNSNPGKQTQKASKKQKQKVIYSQSRFIEEQSGSGPLELDGRELGLFTKSSQKPQAKEQWVCSTVFRQSRQLAAHRGEEYRLSITLLELFEGHYAQLAAEQETMQNGAPMEGSVRETDIEFRIAVTPHYSTLELPPYCPEAAIPVLLRAGIILDFAVITPNPDDLTDIQVDRITELVWWLVLYIARLRTMRKLTEEAKRNRRDEIAELEVKIAGKNAIVEQLLTRHSLAESKYKAKTLQYDELISRLRCEVNEQEKGFEETKKAHSEAQRELETARAQFAEQQELAIKGIRERGAQARESLLAQRRAESLHQEIEAKQTRFARAEVANASQIQKLATAKRRETTLKIPANFERVRAEQELEAVAKELRDVQEILAQHQKQLAEVRQALAEL